MMMKGKTAAASGRPSTPSSGRRLSNLSANSSAGMSTATGSLISNNQETILPNHSRNYSTIYDQTRSSRYRTLTPQISNSLNRDYHPPSPSSTPCSSSSVSVASAPSASASPSPMRRASAAQLSHRYSHSYRTSSRDIPQSYSAGSRLVAGPNSATLGKVSSGTLGSREQGQGRKNGQEIDGLQAGDEEEEGRCRHMRSIEITRSSCRNEEATEIANGWSDESGANDVVESRLGKKMSARASSSSSICKVRGNAMNKYPSRSSSSATTTTTSTQNFSTDCTKKKKNKDDSSSASASSSSSNPSTICAGANPSTTNDPSSSSFSGAAVTSTSTSHKDDDDDGENNSSGSSRTNECCHGNYPAAAAEGAGEAFLNKKKKLESMMMMMKKSNMTCLAGLYNDGNTCYLNSCLQCLVHTVPLASAMLLLSKDHHESAEALPFLPAYSLDTASTSSCCSSSSSISGSNFLQGVRTRSLGLIGVSRKNEPKKDRAHSLAREFHDLLLAMWSPSSTTISASKFLRRLQDWDAQFSGHHQQDAQEAMRAILDGLHESLNHASKPRYIDIYKEYASITKDELAGITWQYHKSSNDSLIQDVFCGQLQSTIECSVCRRNSHCYDPFLDLSLPLPKEHGCRFNNVKKLQVGIQDCLALFVAPETLSGDDKYKCATCKIPQCSTKKLSIYRAPPILVLHLKRFSGSSSSSFKKDNTPVSYPLKGLDLSEFLEASKGEQLSGILYDLYAVCHHSGSIGYGHYTAQCKNIDGLWYSFNDSSVTRVDESCVVSPSAYILFYQLRL